MKNTIEEQEIRATGLRPVFEKKCAEMGCANLFPFKENETYKESEVWEYKAVIKALLKGQPGNIFLQWELDMVDDWLSVHTVNEDKAEFISTEMAAIRRAGE